MKITLPRLAILELLGILLTVVPIAIATVVYAGAALGWSQCNGESFTFVIRINRVGEAIAELVLIPIVLALVSFATIVNVRRWLRTWPARGRRST